MTLKELKHFAQESMTEFKNVVGEEILMSSIFAKMSIREPTEEVKVA